MVISGKIVSGFGLASSTIPWRDIEQYVPDVANFVRGTINVVLEKPFVVLKEDIVTRPLYWAPDLPMQSFGLISAHFKTIKVAGLNWARAWLIRPHFSKHLLNPLLVEVLTSRCEFEKGDPCQVKIAQPCVEASAVFLGLPASPSKE